MRGKIQVNVTGNVMDEPIIRTDGAGRHIANFRVAANQPYTKDGERKENTTIVRCVVFNDNLVQGVIKPFVKKGIGIVLLNGELRNNTYQKDGADIVATEIVFEHKSDLILADARPNEAKEDPFS